MRIIQILPKRTKSSNGQITATAMTVSVTLPYYAPTPFTQGIGEVAEAYMQVHMTSGH